MAEISIVGLQLLSALGEIRTRVPELSDQYLRPLRHYAGIKVMRYIYELHSLTQYWRHPWYSDSTLDHWPAGRAIDPASGA